VWRCAKEFRSKIRNIRCYFK